MNGLLEPNFWDSGEAGKRRSQWVTYQWELMILQSASSQHMRRLAWWSGSMEGGVRMGSTSQFSSDSYNARINSPVHIDYYRYQQWQYYRLDSCHRPILNSPTNKCHHQHHVLIPEQTSEISYSPALSDQLPDTQTQAELIKLLDHPRQLVSYFLASLFV